MSDLDLLRREFASGRAIGPNLYALLWRVVRSTAPQYPPAIYSASQSWDESSLRDLLHGENLSEQWYAFSTDRQIGRARAFLSHHGIRVA